MTSSSLLNPHAIRILNWNIQKQNNPQWHSDFSSLSNNIDLVLFQEVHFEENFLSLFEENWTHSFARGFSTGRRTTGVMTLSSVGHLSHHQFAVNEPLLRTPKATNITTYGLAGRNDTLMVINLHAVNFSLGMNSYQRQLAKVAKQLGRHQGPVIFAGDFNTWHPRRERLIRELAQHAGLDEVSFEEDHRTTVFGKHLDYIFVRGLKAIEAVTHRVNSSDHNPMLVNLTL